jgi:outer membrane murein-binding lipoprotein Lpp
MNTKEHLSKHDREIAAIRSTLKVGALLVTHNQQQLNRLTSEVRQLTASVKELTNSLKRGTNGHTKRKLDLP